MIPKIIYMCHKNLDKIEIYSKNWKTLNPEYEIKLYDDVLCKKFLLDEYSQLHLDIFNFLEDGPIKADFWRICILNKYGGLYVDADIEPLIPLNKYIENDDDFVTCISSNFDKNNISWQFNPHFILCDKNNIILQNTIELYIKSYNNNKPYDYWRWSICMFFRIEGITEKKSQIIYINDKKFKFLDEINIINCEYNGEVVLNNRYCDYNPNTHNFVDKTEIYNTKYGLIELYKNDIYISNEFKNGGYWDINTLLKLREYR